MAIGNTGEPQSQQTHPSDTLMCRRSEGGNWDCGSPCRNSEIGRTHDIDYLYNCHMMQTWSHCHNPEYHDDVAVMPGLQHPW